MAKILLLHVPPVIKGGLPSYYVILAGSGGLGNPFQTAQDALTQLTKYQEQGHTLEDDPVWNQEEQLQFFRKRAAEGQ